MNLALKDISHDLPRFALTAVGLGLLLAIVLAMTGIYNGILIDATALPDSLDADLWIVQQNTRGPFAEPSQVPARLEERARVVAGVATARSFITHTIQQALPDGKPLRMTAVGLSWPDDRGQQLPFVAGRPISQAHYEFLADDSLGLELGQRLRFGRDDYTLVGLTHGLLASGGDPAVFFTESDIQAIKNDLANEAMRLEREARSVRVAASSIGRDPEMVRYSQRSSIGIPALAPPQVSAVMVTLLPGVDRARVREQLEAWPDVSVYSQQDQRDLILGGLVERTRRQIGLFRAVLVLVSTILMGLIIYTMTVDKLHSIALLKLLGARGTVILGMIVQEALILGLIAYGLALVIGKYAFHRFPRRVLIDEGDKMGLLVVVIAISIVASAAGIKKALAADPNEVLAT